MRIIKDGNVQTEYVFDCDVCECKFSLTAKEYASASVVAKCPCCGNPICKTVAYRDVAGLYKDDPKKDK